MKVLITRPKDLADHLYQQLIALNYQPQLFPTLEILPTSKQDCLIQAVKKLNSIDLVIFNSPSSVQFGMDAIQNYWTAFENQLCHLKWAAPGPGTAKALSHFGIKTVIHPKSPPFNSESLLALPEFQKVRNLKIFLFRGNEGRKLLPDSLLARGAALEIVECYQRGRPKYDKTLTYHSKQDDDWHPVEMNTLDVIISTSFEGLKNLFLIAAELNLGNLDWLRKIPIIVVSERMRTEAYNKGIEQIVLAKAATNEHLIEALNNVREVIRNGKFGEGKGSEKHI